MPSAIDLLKMKRDQGYGSPSGEDGEADKPVGERTLELSEEERGNIKPGEPCVLQVSGTLAEDGQFHVESVSYQDQESPVQPVRVRPTSEIRPD